MRRQIETYVFDSVIEPLNWPDLYTYVEFWFRHRQNVLADLFPVHACVAVGGTIDEATPIAAYFWLSILAARMLDDWQDEEGAAHPWNDHPASPLFAVSLLGAAQTALATVKSQRLAEIVSNFGRILTLSAKAQLIQLDELNLDKYLEHKIASTGIVWKMIGWAGAVVGTTNQMHQRIMADIGFKLGMADAIYDDLSDLAADIARGKYTLPIQYAATLTNHPAYASFLALLNCRLQPSSQDNWFNILKDMGALTYALNVARNYQREAKVLIDQLPQQSSSCLMPYVTVTIPS